jgi:hypothetical protein
VVLHLLQVLIHANLKSLTVEELTGRKKAEHLATFANSLAKTVRDLERLAREGKAEERLARDGTRVWQGVTYTMAGLLGKIKGDCETVVTQHAAVAPERCAHDLRCRGFDQRLKGFYQRLTGVEHTFLANEQYWSGIRPAFMRVTST